MVCACPCYQIPRNFDDIADMRMHLHDYHHGCLICSSTHNALTFRSETELLIHLEDCHLACIFECGTPISSTAEALRWHYVERHCGCPYCSIRSFANKTERSAHYDNQHRGLRGEDSYSHAKSKRKIYTGRPKQMRPPPPPPGPVDIYAILNIHSQCSHEEAKRAARQKRIVTHPDKLMREGMSKAETDQIDEMAKLVGFAADIVSYPAKRQEYDEEVLYWKVKHGKI